ncbi:33 kDa chaperonin [Alicyclobacillus contaminans]|uniref:Hsp33 family molecular chaperone HslO n=1 Tax=Alicyclobacillus contaminans TaxID=392016 RepID=UPI000408CAEA|nr:Hsp33 family molecular chaperone HslO [Alicyclobacillus contaminans]GMA50505.1 33 kDa chaperonin [Alicyclobacillus contaminans]
MLPNDTAIRALSKNQHVRALACTSTALINELQSRHDTWPVATAALGRTASVAAMMGLMLKGRERLTVQIKGDGPLGSIVVDADAEGHVRGYVDHPHVHLPANALGKLDVGGGVGQGMLYVMRDLGLKDVYRGSVELQTGEIGDDFTYYFAVSEQTPSAVGAGVLVNTDNRVLAAGGFIVQLLPGHTEADTADLEARLSGLSSVTDILRDGATARELLQMVLPDAEVLDERPISFRCQCSKERMAALLKGLGDGEIQSLIEEQGGAEVTCHFCNEQYQFTQAELETLLSQQTEGEQP